MANCLDIARARGATAKPTGERETMLGSDASATFDVYARSMKPLIVTSDLHFSAAASRSTARDLARLMRDNSGHEFILAGDVFNLSWEAPGRSPVEAVL